MQGKETDGADGRWFWVARSIKIYNFASHDGNKKEKQREPGRSLLGSASHCIHMAIN